jgi:hypothetical protein
MDLGEIRCQGENSIYLTQDRDCGTVMNPPIRGGREFLDC